VLRPDISLANVYFPFGKSAVDLEHAIARGCAKLAPEIATIIRSFNPHQGGDAVFWSLGSGGHRPASLHNTTFNMLFYARIKLSPQNFQCAGKRGRKALKILGRAGKMAARLKSRLFSP
jgi:hypothetical protein